MTPANTTQSVDAIDIETLLKLAKGVIRCCNTAELSPAPANKDAWIREARAYAIDLRRALKGVE